MYEYSLRNYSKRNTLNHLLNIWVNTLSWKWRYSLHFENPSLQTPADEAKDQKYVDLATFITNYQVRSLGWLNAFVLHFKSWHVWHFLLSNRTFLYVLWLSPNFVFMTFSKDIKEPVEEWVLWPEHEEMWGRETERQMLWKKIKYLLWKWKISRKNHFPQKRKKNRKKSHKTFLWFFFCFRFSFSFVCQWVGPLSTRLLI